MYPHGCVARRMGRWKDAVTANIRAYAADVALTQHCMMPYAPEHNTDMLIYAANMGGQVRHACAGNTRQLSVTVCTLCSLVAKAGCPSAFWAGLGIIHLHLFENSSRHLRYMVPPSSPVHLQQPMHAGALPLKGVLVQCQK